MDPLKIAALVCMIGAIVALIMLPVVRFLRIGWHAKRRDIVDGLNEDTCNAYFKMFRRNDNLPDKGKACDDFFKLYDRWYGRMNFLAPTLLLFVSTLVLVLPVVFTILDSLGYVQNPFFKVPIPAIAAIGGAYMWVVDDLISRCRRLDMAPSDIQWCVLRLIVAVPMGYAITSFVLKEVAPFFTFALGAFPLNSLIGILRRKASKLLDIEPTADEVADDIVKLQGTDRAIVERLSNEDIRTVPQIAYCDPVHITMRSSLSFNFVTDLMGQALARIYLKDGLDKITPMGMRGAVEIKHFVENLNDEKDCGEKAKKIAEATLIKLADALGQTEDTVRCVFGQIAEDPYTDFLYRIWT